MLGVLDAEAARRKGGREGRDCKKAGDVNNKPNKAASLIFYHIFTIGREWGHSRAGKVHIFIIGTHCMYLPTLMGAGWDGLQVEHLDDTDYVF